VGGHVLFVKRIKLLLNFYKLKQNKQVTEEKIGFCFHVLCPGVDNFASSAEFKKIILYLLTSVGDP
jgi:hypothetical protein